MNLRPLGDRVVVKQDETKETTDGGLFLVSEAKEKLPCGTVLAVGEGKLNEDGTRSVPPVEVGDRVIYGKYGGAVIAVEDEDVVVLRFDDLMAVLK